MLKFRTMRVDTNTSLHQDYVKTIMDTGTLPMPATCTSSTSRST